MCYNAARTIILDKNKSSKIWLPFISTLFIMATINICCSINFNQLAWIDERGFPGGPLAFIVTQQNRPVNTASLATSIITIFLADGFLVRRNILACSGSKLTYLPWIGSSLSCLVEEVLHYRYSHLGTLGIHRFVFSPYLLCSS